MAKAVGFIGTIHGKSGNVVFRKGLNGTTIMSAYQPQVNNPKTASQVAQRAKMNATGRFSRLWPKKALAPIGGTALRNRSKFNKNCLINSRYYSAENKAAVIPELVDFTFGGNVIIDNVDENILVTKPSDTRATIDINITNANVPDGGVLRICYAYIPGEDSDTPAFARTIDTVIAKPATLAGTTQTTVSFGIPAIDDQTTSRVHVWVMVWTPTTADGRQTYAALSSEGTTNSEIYADWTETNANTGEWSITTYAGNINAGTPEE